MNKKQKTTLYITFGVIILSLIIWQVYGGEIFTKTEVLVEVEDELFGTTKEWRDQFVWGLDLSGIISVVSLVIGGLFMFIFRTNNEK